MGREVDEIQGRLKEFLPKLRLESEMFERAMYKSKNQHRTTIYYLSLSKLRRDLKLLELANLKYILKKHFPIIRGNKPTQAISLLESLKVGKKTPKRVDFQKQLLGVARLLSQMPDTIIESGTKISSHLIGQNFFMPFALTMLAFLARLRVLVQQILLDVVCVFNMSARASQNEQSLKITKEGPQVFRDYYPPNKPLPLLECHWDGVKFCLLEKLVENKRSTGAVQQIILPESGQGSDEQGLPRMSAITYNNIGEPKEAREAEELNQNGSLVRKWKEEFSVNVAVKNERNANENPTFHIGKEKLNLNDNNGPNLDCSLVVVEGNDDSCKRGMCKSFLSKGSQPMEPSSGTKRKVAFVAVDLPSKTTTELERSGKKIKAVSNSDLSEKYPSSAKESLDPFFNLLFDGNKTDSLF